jgi:putative transposase
MAFYANLLDEHSKQYSVSIHAWVFMTNHVHLLATPLKEGAISRMMQAIGRRYVRYFNRKYRRTGTLWEGRYRSSLVQSELYLLQCHKYIELNPVRAGMVAQPADYQWSSHRCHAFGKTVNFSTPHDEYLKLGKTAVIRHRNYQALFQGQFNEDVITDIRQAVNKGLALGGDRFKHEIERLTGRRVRPAKIGRPVHRSPD